MPLPVGLWKANVNGAECELHINEAGGLVTGSLLNEEIHGSWNETAQSVSFVSLDRSHPPDTFRGFYAGYLFSTPRDAQPGRDILWTLCGTLHATPQWYSSVFRNAHPLRNVFGWYAQISQIL